MKSPRLRTILCWVIFPITFVLAWASALAVQVPGPLVETGWLADHQGEVVILDVRKEAASYLGKPLAPSEKLNLKTLTGHIPGAISVPWKRTVSKGEEQGVPLKSMLPSPDGFGELMQASGVSTDSAVVIAGRGSTAKDQAFAARLYFTLKYFGHDNVALLNGGTAQWAKEGRPLAHTEEAPVKGDFAVTEARERLLATTKDVQNAIETGDVQVVDCRTEDFYLGLNFKRKFVSTKHKGHLEGAKTLPFVLLGESSGPAKLYSAEEIRAVADVKGVDLDMPTITYCNTGVTASLGWYALHELLGNGQTQLYDGSMHAWSTVDPSHSVMSLAQIAEAAATGETSGAPTQSEMQALFVRPPRSLQSLVDERRDALRRKRNQYFDAAAGRRLFQPAWMTAREEIVGGYRDSMREANRQHRDTLRLYQDTLRGLYAPWSRPFHDQAEIRHFVSQMEQLDRQELRDSLRFTHAYAPWHLFGY
ncbi:MAG: rhodanese-like domain-containing protein [Pseudomonadota bacterium]|nr:rhodanese-like domain-containing protein [Pseudomonadota bacterium]